MRVDKMVDQQDQHLSLPPKPANELQHVPTEIYSSNSMNDNNRQDHDSSKIFPEQETDDRSNIVGEEVDELRSSIQKFMTNSVVENIFFALIIINSIMMGIGTFDFISEDEDINAVFYYCDLAFLSLFTIELVLTIFYMRNKALNDFWVIFDFLIIGVSWILSMIDSFDPLGKGSKGIQVIRSLRIFRILAKIESWREVLAAVGQSLPKLGCLAIFTFIIMFIFGIFFTEQYQDMYEKNQTEYDYFSRLDYTFFTLYQLLTLDAWIDVLRNIMETYPMAWISFLIYICLTAFVILNLAIAIICESIFELISSKDDEKERGRNKKQEESLEHIIAVCDEIYDQLNLSKPENVVNVGSNGDALGIPQAQSNVFINEDKSTGLHRSMVSESESKNHRTSGTSSCFDGSASRCSVPPRIFSVAKIRNLCGDIVNHRYVQGFVILVIFVNSILLAIGTFDFVTNSRTTYAALEIVNFLFLGFYTVENAMQLIYHGPRDMFSDGWLTFDFILITLSWILSLSPAFRVFRVLRLVHVFPKFKAMRAITGTLYASIPKISAIAGILLFFFYVFAVMFTTLFKDIPFGVENGLSVDYFGRLDKTLLTLFQIMTMEDWAVISRELSEQFWWAHYLTSFFLIISGLLLINAIVALICQAFMVFESSKEDDSESHLEEQNFDKELLDIKAMHIDILNLLKTNNISLKLGAQYSTPPN